MSTGSALVEVTGLELSSRLQKKRKNTQFSVLSFVTCCKMRSAPHANEWHKTCNAAKTDIDSELPLTSFDVTHASLAAVKFKVDMF